MTILSITLEFNMLKVSKKPAIYLRLFQNSSKFRYLFEYECF